MSDIRDRKRRERRLRRAAKAARRDQARALRARTWRCFWAFPFGHVWSYDGPDVRLCVVCEKVSSTTQRQVTTSTADAILVPDYPPE